MHTMPFASSACNSIFADIAHRPGVRLDSVQDGGRADVQDLQRSLLRAHHRVPVAGREQRAQALRTHHGQERMRYTARCGCMVRHNIHTAQSVRCVMPVWWTKRCQEREDACKPALCRWCARRRPCGGSTAWPAPPPRSAAGRRPRPAPARAAPSCAPARQRRAPASPPHPSRPRSAHGAHVHFMCRTPQQRQCPDESLSQK